MAAAMKYLKMTTINDQPFHTLLIADLWLKEDEVRKDVLNKITMDIVCEFVDLDIKYKKKGQASSDGKDEDKVFIYATELLSYGLLYFEFSDSIREGDGTRILHCWRYLTLVFKEAQRKNYAIEGLNLLSQYHFFFSPRQKEQLMWSRCINVHGIPGRNIAADLHFEHLNRMCKVAVENLCSNKTPAALKRVGRCVGVLSKLAETFDKELGISDIFGTHSLCSSDKDMNVILRELNDSNVFMCTQNRVIVSSRLYTSLKKKPLSF